VAENFKAGNEAGVSGTPAFFINGRLLSGAQPYSAFKQAVDAELGAK
jgi:protein-disulfide isomerase